MYLVQARNDRSWHRELALEIASVANRSPNLQIIERRIWEDKAILIKVLKKIPISLRYGTIRLTVSSYELVASDVVTPH